MRRRRCVCGFDCMPLLLQRLRRRTRPGWVGVVACAVQQCTSEHPIRGVVRVCACVWYGSWKPALLCSGGALSLVVLWCRQGSS